MKKLTKIKLINWHGFYNETISINGNVLVTGENGCGKSTLLDAVYFVLSGGDERFNIAANEAAGRSVETYMRGKTGVEGKAFLRNESNLITHIALEFYDTNNSKYFILGVVLEIQENMNKVNRSFYHIPNKKMNDSLFLEMDDDGINYINFKLMKKVVGVDDIEPLDGNRSQIRRKVCSILSIENVNNKYFELLPKAMAFNPIADVNRFVYDFLMPEKNIDIDNIRDVLRSYREIVEQIALETSKKEALKKINEYNNQYVGILSEMDTIKASEVLLKYETLNDEKSKALKDITSSEILNNDLENDRKQLKSLLKDIDYDINQIMGNESFTQMRNIDNDIRHAEDDRKELEEKVKNFNAKLLNLSELLTNLNINLNVTSAIKNSNFSSLITSLKETQVKLNDLEDKNSNELANVKNEIKNLDNNRNGLIKEKDNLEKGIISYSASTNALIKLIKEEIFKEFKEEADVIPFCELIEYKENTEKYRNAIEGYLGNKRFDLFVSKRFFATALETYKKYKDEYGIHSISLVDFSSLPEVEVLENSLANKLTSDDERASKYLNYLLGNVVLTDDELEKYESSVTSSAFVHSSYTYRQKNPSLYKNPFIGRSSKEQRLNNIKLAIDDLSSKLFDLRAKQSELEKIHSLIRNANIATLIESDNVWLSYKNIQTEIENLYYRRDQISVNQELTKDLNTYKARQKEVEEEISAIDEKLKNVGAKLLNAQDKLKNANIALEDITDDYQKLDDNPLIKVSAEAYISDNRLTSFEASKRLSDAKTKFSKLETIIQKEMENYIDNFKFDATPSLDSMNVFLNELNDVITRNLYKYDEELEKVKSNAIIQFENSYIAEIRNNIKNEEQNIKRLNAVLKDKPFGIDEEIYQFEITRSKDEQFGKYYDIFKSNEDFYSKDLFTDSLSDKNAALMKELLQRLTTDNSDANQEKLMKRYTDYREFMNYDIKITNKRGEELYFSKINKEKSGGETQTPFYVIIAASFDQIVRGNTRGNRSSGCIVMFDEAFNNMDESRIESMMEYFNKLSIQPIIAVPTQRSAPIMKFVDTIVVLIKSNNRVMPRLLMKDEIK